MLDAHGPLKAEALPGVDVLVDGIDATAGEVEADGRHLLQRRGAIHFLEPDGADVLALDDREDAVGTHV